MERWCFIVCYAAAFPVILINRNSDVHAYYLQARIGKPVAGRVVGCSRETRQIFAGNIRLMSRERKTRDRATAFLLSARISRVPLPFSIATRALSAARAIDREIFPSILAAMRPERCFYEARKPKRASRFCKWLNVFAVARKG